MILTMALQKFHMMQRSGKYDKQMLADILLDVEETLEGTDLETWHKSLYSLTQHTDPYEVTRIANKLPKAGLDELDRHLRDIKQKEETEAYIQKCMPKKQAFENLLRTHTGIIKLNHGYDNGSEYYWDPNLRLMYEYTLDCDIEVVSPVSTEYLELVKINNIQH